MYMSRAVSFFPPLLTSPYTTTKCKWGFERNQLQNECKYKKVVPTPPFCTKPPLAGILHCSQSPPLYVAKIWRGMKLDDGWPESEKHVHRWTRWRRRRQDLESPHACACVHAVSHRAGRRRSSHTSRSLACRREGKCETSAKPQSTQARQWHALGQTHVRQALLGSEATRVRAHCSPGSERWRRHPGMANSTRRQTVTTWWT